MRKHPTLRLQYQGKNTSHLPRAWRSATECLPTTEARSHSCNSSSCARSPPSPYSNPTRGKHKSAPSRFLPHPTLCLLALLLGRGGEEIPTPALPVVGLWPKIPLKKAGIRMLPPMSEPTPMTEQAAARTPPSPPAWEETQQGTPQCKSSSKAGASHGGRFPLKAGGVGAARH